MTCRSSTFVFYAAVFAAGLLAFVSSFQSAQSIRSHNHKWRSTTLMVAYPTKIRNVITKMTESTQSALQKMTSRMEIELPPGADFGVEASGKQASKQRATLETNADKVKKSNREAARLVAEMFSVLSSTSIAIFPSESEASDARIKWGSTFKGQVFSIDAPAGGKSSGNLYSKRKSPQEQEQALLGSDGVYIPEGTQLIIVAGPRAKDIKKLKKIHERLGEETLIIFINARASIAAASTSAKRSASATIDSDVESDNDDWVTGAFTPVFHYAPPLINVAESEAGLKGKDTKRELLLYHEYGGDWYLAEKEVSEGLFGTGISLPGNSGFKTLWEGKARPQKEELINSLKIAK